jgi:hypothetical protein
MDKGGFDHVEQGSVLMFIEAKVGSFFGPSCLAPLLLPSSPAYSM